MKYFLYFLLLPILAALLPGCSSLAYYGQAVSGHLDVMQRRQPAEPLIADPHTPSWLRERLQLALAMRAFASAELALPENDSYRTYADLERPYVVWNVVATPPLSMRPRQWCFLFVGCLQYRGYYTETAAREFSDRLAARGDDTYVGGAAAYSTLGWFDDPLLNTMLDRNDAQLAQIIFHELAHQKIYVRDDTAFNEAFADTVGIVGARRWLQQQGGPAALAAYDVQLEHHDQLLELLFSTRQKLAALYASDLNEIVKRERKQAILADLERHYRQLRRTEWRGYPLYDRWFAEGVNNAKLAAVATYRKLVPDFMRLLEASDGRLPHFYARVAALADCSREARRRWLAHTGPVPECPVGAPELAKAHANR